MRDDPQPWTINWDETFSPEHTCRWPERGNAPLVHERQPGAITGGQIQIMGYNGHADSLTDQLQQQIEEVYLMLDI